MAKDPRPSAQLRVLGCGHFAMECLGENTVTDLVDALLAPERRAVVEAHTAQCETCRRLVSELIRRSVAVAEGSLAQAASAAPRSIEPGTRVGRYVVRAQIGSSDRPDLVAVRDYVRDSLAAWTK